MKRQGKSRQKLDPSSFILELFFVRTQKYVDTYCIRLSNYITPNMIPVDEVPFGAYLSNEDLYVWEIGGALDCFSIVGVDVGKPSPLDTSVVVMV